MNENPRFLINEYKIVILYFELRQEVVEAVRGSKIITKQLGVWEQ